ncbi:MAG: DinB family protein, partial [Flavobacteriaceae bacterium]|nr:DinB family protein [Flavobacteriaceae bacterium]
MENYDHIVKSLHQNKTVFQSLFENISEEQQFWKPSPDSWCLLEVLCHLLDEERLDFRFRAEFILNNPGEIPPPFD